jgi:hypothetical protein
MFPGTQIEEGALTEAQRIFFEALPKFLRCADDEFRNQRTREKKLALVHKHIQVNYGNRKVAMLFDIDRKGAALASEDAGLPVPTVTLVNQENGHAHLIYLLESPVYFDPKHPNFANHLPWHFYERIRCAYRDALDADTAYAGRFVKNPFHPAWWVIWTGRKYTFAELAEGYPGDLPLRKRHPSRRADDGSEAVTDDEIVREGRRNNTLFDRGRVFAYDTVHKVATESDLYNALYKYCRTQNTNCRPPLHGSDVRATSRSITQWTWRHRATIGKKRHEAQDPSVTLANRKNGVATARAIRTEKLLSRLSDHLQRVGSHPSISSLARGAGMDRKTVRRFLLADRSMPERSSNISDRRDLSPQGRGRLAAVVENIAEESQASDFRTTVRPFRKGLFTPFEGPFDRPFADIALQPMDACFMVSRYPRILTSAAARQAPE